MPIITINHALIQWFLANATAIQVVLAIKAITTRDSAITIRAIAISILIIDIFNFTLCSCAYVLLCLCSISCCQS